MKTDEWYTPLDILRPLGQFDLDPCSPIVRPWDTAKVHYTIVDNGLLLPWNGRVWLNPPYGHKAKAWIERMSEHLNGIALLFARTDTAAWQRFIFPYCSSLFFLEGRVDFYNRLGIRARNDGGGPSVLIAYGEYNVDAIDGAKLKGRHVLVNSCPIIVVGISPTWKEVVRISIGRLSGEGSLQEIYDLVEMIAPDKIKNNSDFKAKVRQTCQYYFSRIAKGKYKA